MGAFLFVKWANFGFETMASVLQLPSTTLRANNLVAGVWEESNEKKTILSPYSGKPLGEVSFATEEMQVRAISSANEAAAKWGATPIKERTTILLKFRELLLRDLEKVAHYAASEAGKTLAEARAEVLKGVEVLEFACSVQNLDIGGALEVSRGVTCEYKREALGVVVGVTPFNFPAMVPMWMIPIALVLGNSFILKPSDKVPFTPGLLGVLLAEAGLPPGVFSILHGGRELVTTLTSDPVVQAVGFVGSTAVARSVYGSATAHGKRALCLGGAKNHLIVVPDADPSIAVDGVVSSFTGCAGQRCMAASVLIAVGDVDHVIAKVVSTAGTMRIGLDMGAVIDATSRDRLHAAIARAEGEGATVLLDGRNCQAPVGCEGGFWLGPTILDRVAPSMECACTELFGPVISIIRVNTLDEALSLDAASPYGNATSVFTTSGSVARIVSERSRSGMIGINIGVPVPREPFSFGGTKESKFGCGDITGSGGVEFWSSRKKITSKWAVQSDKNWMS